jgi:hypothetical protein
MNLCLRRRAVISATSPVRFSCSAEGLTRSDRRELADLQPELKKRWKHIHEASSLSDGIVSAQYRERERDTDIGP